MKIFGQVEILGKIKFSSYLLAKWRAYCKKRDGSKCYFCPDTNNLEVHHIEPKSLRPDIAYLMANGITLCFRCHRCVVHASNTWDLNNWSKFVPTFKEYIAREEIVMFNLTKQKRISRVGEGSEK